MEIEIPSEPDSYADVLLEIIQTYETVESAADMSRSPTTNDDNPLENARPNPANVSEWVEQQSLPMPAPKVVISKSNPESKFETRQSTSGNLAREDPQRKVYGITKLLSLGESIPMEHMELRIHPGALIEHIFKDKNQKTYPKFQEKPRHRGPSDHSTWTHRTNRSEEENVFPGREWVSAQKAYREPQNPPKEQFAQQHEGFKRFLKQVASPPHNRVTAGGRIVPAGPSFPPPMLNYGSIETTINPSVLKTSLSVNAGTKSNVRVGGTDLHTTSHILPGQQKINQNTNPSGLHQLEAGQVLENGNVNRGGFDANLPIVPTTQFPQGIEPLYWLAGGGAIVSLNGLQYRASWNGPQLVLETLQTAMQATPFFTMTPEHAAIMYAQVNHGSNYPTAVKPVTASGTQTNPNTTSAYTSYQLPPRNQSSRNASQEEHENLRARLTELDKHLALYHHKLSVFEHSALVAQRKQLVEKIDFIRKNRNERTNSYSAPVVGQHTAIGMQPPHQRPEKNAEHLPSAIVTNGTSSLETQRLMGNSIEINHGAAQATILNKKPFATSTCLSPDAPPFFPSNIKAGSDNPSLGYPWGASVQSKYSFGNLNTQDDGRVPNYSSKIGVSRVTQATQAPHLTTQKEGQGANAITSRSEESAQEPLPVVLREDVEYADRLGLNPTRGAKLYCTTVPEFQEVIRRVREQARLYGCKGGQSKDPAFDAEQDIRWAMADHDPIRLPGSTPDHIAEPYPWSWNDSVFNAQTRNGSASINGHSSQTYVTSNSQEKSSGADILDDPFSVFTQRRGDSWESDPGVDGAIQFTVDHKQPQFGVTATDPAGAIAQDNKCQSEDPEPNGAPSTPKYDRKRSLTMQDVSNRSAIHTPSTSNKGKTPQSPRRSYQSYVGESFGTPTSGRAQVTSRGFPASAKKDEGPSKPDDHPEHLNSRGRPAYRVRDLETGQFITLDDLPTGHAYETVCVGYENCVIGPTDPTENEVIQNYDSWAPITDSKSRWGPEEDNESLDAWGIPKSYDWVASTPRVNIPSAMPKPSAKPAGYVPPELRKAKRPVNDFLRGILKSPHYAYPQSSQSVSSAAETRLRLNHRADLEKRARLAINKENLKGEVQCRMERTTAHGPSSSTVSVVGQDPRKHKARSSLASSTFQVQGHLGRTGQNAEHVDSSSQPGSGYTPQHPCVKRHAQILETPLREGPPDFHFPTEVRRNHHAPGHSSRPSIPQYDGALDDMTGSIDFNYQHSSEKNTPLTRTSQYATVACDSRELMVDDDYINKQHLPARQEAFVNRLL